MNLNGQASASPNPGPVPYESILFYDEHIEDDYFNFELIEELFLNPKRQPVKVAKEGTVRNQLNPTNVAQEVNNFSRIDTDNDGNDSDSSIQQNVTYQALQTIKFPNNIKMGTSRDQSPDTVMGDNY